MHKTWISRAFGMSTDDGAARGTVTEFYSDKVGDSALAAKIRAVNFVRGAGYNNLLTKTFDIPIEGGEQKSIRTFLTLRRKEEEKSWDILEIRQFNLGTNDKTGLDGSIDENPLGTAKCLFDALACCAEFEQTHQSRRTGKAGEGYEDIASWRKAAADAGQIISVDGALIPCADGATLVDAGPYPSDQKKILALTRKPDPVELRRFTTLFSGAGQEQTPKAKEAEEIHEMPARNQKDPAPAGKEEGSGFFLKLGAGTLAALALVNALHNGLQPDPDATLMEAAEYGNIQRLTESLERGAKVNKANADGETALLEATFWGSTKIVRKLIEEGADVNAADRRGRTPLLQAAYSLNTGIARILVDAKADVNAVDKDGWTALHYAASYGLTEMIRMLIENGANINAKQPNSGTALMLAIDKKETETARALIELGADIKAADKDGWTALKFAEAQGNIEIISLLRKVMEKDAGASIPARTPKENKPAPLASAFVVTGESCTISGSTIHVGAGKEISTIPLPQGCAPIPR